MVARCAGAVSRAAPGRAIRDPGAGGDARADRDGGPGRPLHGKRGCRDRGRLVARRGGSRGASLGVGRAASLRLPRRRGLRAAAERPGCGRARRAGALRRSPSGSPLAARGDEARPRRRARACRGRAAAAVTPRARAPGEPSEARRAGVGARAATVSPAAGRHDLSLRGRRRRHRDLADPERLRLVRLGRRRAWHRRRPPEPRGGLRRGRGSPESPRPGRRPFHTIIPGMLLEGGSLLGPFGVMGGPMQPQGHMQVVLRLVDHGDDPQAALDAPRWRVGDRARGAASSPGSGMPSPTSPGSATRSRAVPSCTSSVSARRSSASAAR